VLAPLPITYDAQQEIGMITIVKNPRMVRVRSIMRDGVEIGTVCMNAKNYAYAHHGRFVVFSNHFGESERFHTLKGAIAFCKGSLD
jgi:hypothetical protein